MKINEIKTERALGLTKISLADYVINHYIGCQHACLYCYAKYLKRYKKYNLEWGEFLKIKTNVPELLDKEIPNKKPEKVMLGSITEVYQPIEKRYELTRKILEKLVKYQIPTVILTRDKLILRDLDLLKQLPECSVFFTISSSNDKIFELFEKVTPSYTERLNTIKNLFDNGINVWVHTGPVIPYFNNTEKILYDVKDIVNKIEFESLNVTTAPLHQVYNKLKKINKLNADKLLSLYKNKSEYDNYWSDMKQKILSLTDKYNLKTFISFSEFNEFF